MKSMLIVAAAAEHEENPLGFVWVEFLLSLVVFGILFFLIWKFVAPRFEQVYSERATAIEGGLYQPVMKARMTELERQKADIATRMAHAPHAVPDVHPGIAALYRRQVERLVQALQDPETRLDASEAIRSLIHRIVPHPGDRRGEVHATLHGALLGILDLAHDTPGPNTTALL